MIDQKLVDELKQRAQAGDAGVLRSPEFKALFDQIKTMPAEERGAFGKQVNALRQELDGILKHTAAVQDNGRQLSPIDITAPFDVNVPSNQRSGFLPAETGSVH